MQSQDFVAVLELTDEYLINLLDKLEEDKTNGEKKIGVYDSLNKKINFSICKDTFKLKIQKAKTSKQNMLIKIDNIEYVDYTNYIDYLKEYKKKNGKKLNKFQFKNIMQKQKEEHKKRILQSKKSNIEKRLNLGNKYIYN